jgi:hypothetical protein
MITVIIIIIIIIIIMPMLNPGSRTIKQYHSSVGIGKGLCWPKYVDGHKIFSVF